MRPDTKVLDRREFDVLVIGGGIQGAAMAREAALRGASVLLAEKTDFACATSSNSSRLIHGGLRYLEHGHLALVREALHERERLLRLAPHLVRPLPMLMPYFKGGSRRPFVMKAGLKLYGLLAGRHSLPGARSQSVDDCLRLFPALRRRELRGGSLFYDARTVDQRLTMAVVEGAHAAGAVVVNHLAVAAAVDDQILLRDLLADREIRVRAKHVLNAAGPAVDHVRRLLGIDGSDLVRLSRGSHLVLDPIPGEVALAAFLPDRRIQFVIPHDGGTICGTTEEVEENDRLSGGVPAADVEYLLEALAYLYETPPTSGEVRHAYIGWRALPVGRGPAGGASREAFLHRDAASIGAVHTLVGGKLTTHRAFAERTINQLLDLSTASPSRDEPLPGGAGPQEFGDPLWWRHGDRTRLVRQLADGPDRLADRRNDLLEPICPHRDMLRAEAVFGLKYQGAMTFADLMRRRLFHVQGPCLEAGCLADCHALYAEFAPEGVDVDADRDKASLIDEVRQNVGAATARP